ncbi:MAG: hypothetical protein L6Q75_12145 [Burkholderiaceae bacterium]|nr:hypothetical protein [Burkholderiaceae bacterium]
MPARRAEAGGSMLALLLVLLAGLALALLYSHRALIFEQRSAALQLRSALALHAAEAGRDWLLVRLNHPGPLDAGCEPVAPTPGSTPTSLRERWLDLDPATGELRAAAVRPACVHDGQGWQCLCPAAGAAVSSAPDPATSPGDRPAFALSLAPGPRPGSLRLSVTGCSSVGRDCGGDAAPDARVTLRQLLQPLGALLHLPGAALQAGGRVTVEDGVTLQHEDPAGGGLVLQAGAAVTLDPRTRLLGPPGRPAAQTWVAQDPSLAGSADAQLRRLFGLAADTVAGLPGWQRLDCRSGCDGTAVEAALAQGRRSLWLDGDLQLTGPAQWGDAQRPLLLRVRGQARLAGALQLHGLLIADAIDWQASAGASAGLQGAAISLGDARLAGPLWLRHDRSVLLRLRDLPGLYLPVPGSWQDFDNR